MFETNALLLLVGVFLRTHDGGDRAAAGLLPNPPRSAGSSLLFCWKEAASVTAAESSSSADETSRVNGPIKFRSKLHQHFISRGKVRERLVSVRRAPPMVLWKDGSEKDSRQSDMARRAFVSGKKGDNLREILKHPNRSDAKIMHRMRPNQSDVRSCTAGVHERVHVSSTQFRLSHSFCGSVCLKREAGQVSAFCVHPPDGAALPSCLRLDRWDPLGSEQHHLP